MHFAKAHSSYTLRISEQNGKKIVQADIFNCTEDKTILCDIWSEDGPHTTYFATVNQRASIFTLTPDNRLLDWSYINISGYRKSKVIRSSRVKVIYNLNPIQNELQ